VGNLRAMLLLLKDSIAAVMDELFLESEEINLIRYVFVLILGLNWTELRLISLDLQENLRKVFGHCFAETFNYFSDTGQIESFVMLKFQ